MPFEFFSKKHNIFLTLIISNFLLITNVQSFDIIENILTRNRSQFSDYTIENIIKAKVSEILRVLNEICGFVHYKIIKLLPSADYLSLTLFGKAGQKTYKLENINDMLNDPLYNVSLPLTIFIGGWLSSYPDSVQPEVIKLMRAYNELGKFNFVILNLGRSLRNLYTWATYNTKDSGTALGKVLANFTTNEIHLIGASLGAQIAQHATIAYNSLTGRKISRLTGIEPADFCYNMPPLVAKNLSLVNFVDAIHSESIFQNDRTWGHADFYPIIVKTLFKDGCSSIVCSHSRIIEYFAETVQPGQATNFESTQCPSKKLFNSKQCSDERKAFMGLEANKTNLGKYFLYVNVESPYGMQHGLTDPNEDSGPKNKINEVSETSENIDKNNRGIPANDNMTKQPEEATGITENINLITSALKDAEKAPKPIIDKDSTIQNPPILNDVKPIDLINNIPDIGSVATDAVRNSKKKIKNLGEAIPFVGDGRPK